MLTQLRISSTSMSLGLVVLVGPPTTWASAAEISVPTIVVKAQVAATQRFSLAAAGGSPQTGFALRAQLGDGDGLAVEPVFTEIGFNLPLWRQFDSLPYGGPVAGATQYAEGGVVYAQPGQFAAATGDVVRVGVSTAGVSAGLYPLALSGTDIGVDSTFVGTNGADVPTTITNGQLYVYADQVTIPTEMINAIAFGPINSTGITVAGKLTVAQDAGTTITQSIAVTGFLDLTNNDLIVRGQTVASVRSLVSTWYTASTGLPGTTGLGSSAAFYSPEGAFTTLAVFDNSIAGQTLTTFNNIPVLPTDVLVKYTYLGDTNLDGVVDATDLSRLLAGLNGQGSGWNFGDVNYDGVVNFVDLGRTMAALRGQGAPLNVNGSCGGAPIPEPASLGILLVAIPVIGWRRR